MLQTLKSALVVLRVAITLQSQYSNVTSLFPPVLGGTGFFGFIAGLYFAGIGLDNLLAEPDTPAELLWAYALPVAGVAVLILIAGARIHAQTIPRLRIGPVTYEPNPDGGVWVVTVHNSGKQAALQTQAVAETLVGKWAYQTRGFISAPLNWPRVANPCMATILGGGQPHRLDLVRNDPVAVENATTLEPEIVSCLNVAYCGLDSEELLRRSLHGPDPLHMLVSIATEKGPELFLQVSIDPLLAGKSPESAVTIEWQGRSRPSIGSIGACAPDAPG